MFKVSRGLYFLENVIKIFTAKKNNSPSADIKMSISRQEMAFVNAAAAVRDYNVEPRVEYRSFILI